MRPHRLRVGDGIACRVVIAGFFGIWAFSMATATSPSEGVVITFSVSGSVAEQGVLIIADRPFERGFVRSHLASIQAVFRASDPPRNLNACYVMGNAGGQLIHVTKGGEGSYVLQVVSMADAGEAYSFKLESGNVVSGHGGFYATDIRASDKITGTYKRAADAVAECVRLLPKGT